MSNVNTKIEWTDATWSPVTGCTKVSAGCKHCYAERLFPRVYGRESVGSLATGDYRQRQFTDVRCHPERLDQPLRWKKPRRIFVNSMSDLFHEDVPDEFILQVFDVMRQSLNGHAVALNRLAATHTFQILTKRAWRMQYFMGRLVWDNGLRLGGEGRPAGPMLKNVWLGVSVENQATADERMPLLLQTPAAVRFVSYEPALGSILFRRHIDVTRDGTVEGQIFVDHLSGIDWLIAGGESGPNARPSHPDWFRSVRDQCEAAGVSFFFKQWGEWMPRSHSGAGMMNRDGRWGTVTSAGEFFEKTTCWNGHDDDGSGEAIMFRVGKKTAGRTLDGHIHDEYPA